MFENSLSTSTVEGGADKYFGTNFDLAAVEQNFGKKNKHYFPNFWSARLDN